MADVITRFRLETTQYDSKLRDAAKGLKEVVRVAELGGKGFTGFNQKAIEAARSLGTIESGANNTKDRLKDLVGSFNEAAKAYNNLSKEQQQSDFGKAMAQSLEQLQVRIKDTKQELYGLSDAAEKVKSSGLFGEGGLTGMLQVAGGSLIAQGATALASSMKDAVSQGIELARQGEGIRVAFERLNNPNLLANLKEATHGTVSELELMKAAVKFDDFKLPVEELGTMLAFAQKKAKDTGQSIDYMVDSIVTGLGRKSLMILDNLGLSAAEIRERMKESGDMTKAVGEIIREQMAKAGDYVETAADRAARATAQAQDKMMELGRSAMPVAEEFNNAFNTIKVAGMQLINIVLVPIANMIDKIRQFKQSPQDFFENNVLPNTMTEVGSNVDDKGNYIRRPAQKGAAGFDWEKGTWKPGYYGAIYNSATGQTEFPDINVNGTRREKKTPTTTTTTGGHRQTEEEIIAEIEKGLLAGLQKQVEGTKAIEAVGPSAAFAALAGSQSTKSTSFVDAFAALNKAEGINPSGKASQWKLGKNGQLVEVKNKEERTAQEQLQGTQTMISSLQSIVGGIESLGIELPQGLSNVLGALQTITGILGAIQTMQQVGTWLGLFKNGGIVPHAANGYYVPGNNYSGDVTPVLANAGELILNRAAQNSIASQLSGGGMQNLQLSASVSGEDIILSVNNALKRRNKGEIATWR